MNVYTILPYYLYEGRYLNHYWYHLRDLHGIKNKKQAAAIQFKITFSLSSLFRYAILSHTIATDGIYL